MYENQSVAEAEAVLTELAAVFFQNRDSWHSTPASADRSPDIEVRYRALVEQIPAVVFMAYLDKGIGEAYVSPQIEKTLGFSQKEWLEDPIRWYEQIHPDDKQRWSLEAAEMFLSGTPLRSAYRVIARDGHAIWFHCEAKMIREQDGRPWFIHGIAFDITELKHTEEALQQERNVVSAILNTVGALVVALDPSGRIVRFNRACEETTGYSFAEVRDKRAWDLFTASKQDDSFKAAFEQLRTGRQVRDYESFWLTRSGAASTISWSNTVLTDADGEVSHIIATGIDITERKRLEKAVLEISEREQRRIGQDLHDGLGQHLTGIAFLSKVQEQKLAEKELAEAVDAAKVVHLVNQAIQKTRELARGLLPVLSESHGLMSALQQRAGEVEDLFGIRCHLECDDPVLIHDGTMASHLYHIAQEATHNAIKHGKANHVVIGLQAAAGRGSLTIRDDGAGMSEQTSSRTGMGLHLMTYRAKMICGSLDIRNCEESGVLVTCSFPVEVSR